MGFQSFFRIGPGPGALFLVRAGFNLYNRKDSGLPLPPSLHKSIPIAPIRPCWVVLLPLLCRCQPHLPQHPSNQIHFCSHSRSCFPSCVHVGPLPTHDWYRFSPRSCGQHLGSDGQHCVELRTLSRRERLPVSPMVFLKDLSQRRKSDNDLLHESLPGTLWRCICGPIGLYPFRYSAFPKTPCAQVGHVFPVQLRRSLSWFKIWMSRRPVERKSGIDRPHLSRWPLFFLVGSPCLTYGTLRFFFIEVVFLLQGFFSTALALPRLGAGQGCEFFRLYFMTFFGIGIGDFLAITALSIRNKPVQILRSAVEHCFGHVVALMRRPSVGITSRH